MLVNHNEEKNGVPIPLFKNRMERLMPSFQQEVLPEDEIKSIEEDTRKKITEKKISIREKFKRIVDTELKNYENSELIELCNNYREEQRGPVSKRRSMEANKRIESEKESLGRNLKKNRKNIDDHNSELEKLASEIFDLENTSSDDDLSIRKKLSKLKADHENLRKKIRTLENEWESIESELNGLELKYNPDKRIEEDLNHIVNEFRTEHIRSERINLDEKYKKNMDFEISEAERAILEESNERINQAKEDNTRIRFHVYFKLDLGEERPQSFTETVNKKMVQGLYLRADMTGSKAIIERQQTSLNNLRNGYTMNPFLATALFDPPSGNDSIQPDIEEFFLDNLNADQKRAVSKAVSSNGIFLIQGPPGTGKTHVIAEITAQLVTRGRKVLIASENNKAVDNAFGRISEMPSIRKLRLIADKTKSKENEYTVGKLLENFYRSISNSLEREIEKSEDRRRYENELRASREDLIKLRIEIDDCERAAEDIAKSVHDAQRELDEAYAELERKRNDNTEIETEIDIIDGEMQEIDEFDEALVQNIAGLIDLGNYVDADDYQTVLKELASSDRLSIVKEYGLCSEHREYLKLLEDKKKAITKEKPNLNKRIHEYEEDKGISRKDTFPILGHFLPDIPDMEVVLDLRDIVIRELDSLKRNLRDKRSCFVNSRYDLAPFQDTIVLKKKKIEALKDNPQYSKLESLRKEFNERAKDIFVKLNLVRAYRTPEDAIRSIENELDAMSLEPPDSPDVLERRDCFKKISQFIDDKDVLKNDSETFNSELMNCVNVFGMTCTSDGKYYNEEEDNRNKIPLNTLNIDVVIIDEVSKVPFIELLLPILYGKTVILVGDQNQLSPIFQTIDTERLDEYDGDLINENTMAMCKSLYEEPYFGNLFEKTPKSNKFVLTEQYRMHPDIMEVDNLFYGGKLKFGGNSEFKEHYLDIRDASGKSVISPDDHVVIINCKGKEDRLSGSTSYINNREVDVVINLLSMMDSHCNKDRDGSPISKTNRKNDNRLSVGVICPYKDQKNEIYKRRRRYTSFNESNEDKFMVKSVDDFQGDERDIIILSMVRKHSDFLNDFHRINVAVSRARRLLVIVGDFDAMKKNMVEIDGKKKPIYREMMNIVQRKNGFRSDEAFVRG